MSSFAEWVFDFGYKREWYEPVRNDFIQWYSYAYDHPSLPRQFAETNVSEFAYRVGKSAIKYEPDNAIVNSIDVIEEYRAKLNTLLKYLTVCSAAFATLAGGAWQINLNIVVPGILGTFSGLFMTPPALYFVLKHQIYANTELVRKINNELVKMDLELWTNRNPRYRVAYLYWNHSLNDPGTLVVLVFLAVVRGISPGMYDNVNEFLRRNMVEYVEKGVWEVSKKELKRAWDQATEAE